MDRGFEENPDSDHGMRGAGTSDCPLYSPVPPGTDLPRLCGQPAHFPVFGHDARAVCIRDRASGYSADKVLDLPGFRIFTDSCSHRLARTFIRLGIREDEPYVPTAIPTRQEWFDAVLRTVVVSAAACFALKYNVRFVIAPPLLVAFTEFSRPLNPARKRPVKVILLLTACAAAGTLCRLVLTNAAGLPLSVSAGAATLIMMLLVRKTGMYMPPAGAVTILTFLVPDEALVFFPLQVLAGISLLMGITLLMFEPLQKGRA